MPHISAPSPAVPGFSSCRAPARWPGRATPPDIPTASAAGATSIGDEGSSYWIGHRVLGAGQPEPRRPRAADRAGRGGVRALGPRPLPADGRARGLGLDSKCPGRDRRAGAARRSRLAELAMRMPRRSSIKPPTNLHDTSPPSPVLSDLPPTWSYAGGTFASRVLLDAVDRAHRPPARSPAPAPDRRRAACCRHGISTGRSTRPGSSDCRRRIAAPCRRQDRANRTNDLGEDREHA